ncbi:caspase family protein [Candidatus Pelagibacter sp.]|nr:caspase family protein [Candidatus Pelagibacter sp.]
MKRLLVYLFIVLGLGLILNINANAAKTKKIDYLCISQNKDNKKEYVKHKDDEYLLQVFYKNKLLNLQKNKNCAYKVFTTDPIFQPLFDTLSDKNVGKKILADSSWGLTKTIKKKIFLKEYENLKTIKKEPSQTKKKSTKIKEFKDLPDSEFYFYAFKDNKDLFIGYLNQDPKSKLIEIGNRKFREGNKGKAYTVNGNTCKVYSSVDKPNTKNRTYTGTATLDCKNNVKYVGNWVQYGPKGSGKGINENTGESIDFYFTMNRLTAIADLKYFKEGQKIKVAKIEQEETNQEEFKPKKTNQDNEAPVIEIAEVITVNDTDYEFQGKVTDKAKTIYVEVDGRPTDVKNGKFVVKGYSPIDKQISIEAIDQWGNRSEPKIVKLKIDIKDTIVAEKLEPLNPSKIRSKSSKDKVALIIGIENYLESPNASYANLDAKYFFDYARKGFGVKKQNINLLVDEDATFVKTNKALTLWLKTKIKANQTDLIVFFAGHGLASNDGKELYLLPQDSDPNLLDITALSRTKLFKTIIDLKPKSVTMFLDTCYSGVSRDEQTLLASARPIRIMVDEQEGIPNNFTIFTASQVEQISSGIKEAKHGIFSYYLMKGLEGNADSNNDKKITNGELLAYMDEKVSQKAAELGRQQNPSLAGDPDRVLMNYR